jgi:hypothetical protein
MMPELVMEVYLHFVADQHPTSRMKVDLLEVAEKQRAHSMVVAENKR